MLLRLTGDERIDAALELDALSLAEIKGHNSSARSIARQNNELIQQIDMVRQFQSCAATPRTHRARVDPQRQDPLITRITLGGHLRD